jgi:hypothetical protein
MGGSTKSDHKYDVRASVALLSRSGGFYCALNERSGYINDGGFSRFDVLTALFV